MMASWQSFTIKNNILSLVKNFKYNAADGDNTDRTAYDTVAEEDCTQGPLFLVLIS